jgi:hypothetical protein
MDCPHCGEENLVGARICGSCGRNMTAQPAFRPTASPTSRALPPVSQETDDTVSDPAIESAGPSAREGPVQSLCRVCLSAFDRRPEQTGAPICPTCRESLPSEADAGRNDVQIHPNARTDAAVDPRLRSAHPRRPPVSVRTRSRTGPVVALVGLVLGLSSMGVVAWTAREKDPAGEYFADVRSEPAPLKVRPATTGSVELESTTNVTLQRQMVRANFGSNLEDMVRIEQKSVQTAIVAHVRDEENGVVVDVASECRVATQTGTAHGNDARDAEVYPWRGHKATQRLLLAPGTDSVVVGDANGARPIVGCDVVPCFSLGDLGAPTVAVTPGARWRHAVTLPFYANREGGLVPIEFAAEITYEGRRVIDGCACVGFRLKATAPSRPPAPLGDMNRMRGNVTAALFFEQATGLLCEAHFFGDVSASLERGRIDERVSVGGTIDVRRR